MEKIYTAGILNLRLTSITEEESGAQGDIDAAPKKKQTKKKRIKEI